MNEFFTAAEWQDFTSKLNGIYIGYHTGLVYRFPKTQLERISSFDPGYHWMQLWDNGKLVMDY